MREFSCAETFIKQTNRLFLIFFCVIAVCLVIFALYFSNFRIERALIAAGKTLLFAGIIFFIEILLINRRLRKLKVLIYEDKLVRQCGKKQNVLIWNDITGIKMFEKKNGDVAVIRLFLKNPKRTIYLSGFREMEDMANHIKERISNNVPLEEKRWKLDWQSPSKIALIMVPVMIVTMIVMAVICSMGSKVIDIFAISFAFAVGLILLIFRPLAKCDIFNKWIDLAFGAVLIIAGLYGLIEFLSSGKLP